MSRPASRPSRDEAAPLRETQAWFNAVITHPSSVAEGVAQTTLGAPLGVLGEQDLERVVTAGPALSALGRVEIYRHAYHARLIDCLADDYPALQHALGDAFDGLARAYIEHHPSTEWSLNGFGRHVPAFCRARAEPWRDFAADLAALEWAMVEVLHAAEAPALSIDALGAIAAEKWAGARFVPSPAVRLLRSGYAVNAYFQAFRDDRELPPTTPAPSATAVYRRGWTIWRMNLTPPMASLLEGIFAGKTLEESFDVLEAGAGAAGAPEELAQSVMVWFREWVASGLFASVDAGDSP